MPLTMNYAVNARGGFLSVPGLSKKLRVKAQQKAKLRQFTEIEKAFGMKMGNTLYFDRAGNVSNAGSVTGISESQTMPETTFDLTQGSVVVTEYGNSVRYTGKLLDLSTISITDAAEEALTNDQFKTLDLAIRGVARSTDVKVKYAATGTDAAPTSSFDTDGTQSTAFTRKLQVFDLKEVVDYLEGTLFADPWADDNYIWLGSVGANRALFDSTGFQDAATNSDPAVERIWRGEVGTYYRTRVIRETHAFANTTNGFGGEAIVFGKEAFVEAIARPPSVIAKEPMDFGRDKGLAWYAIWGVNEIWDTAADARIVHLRGTT